MKLVVKFDSSIPDVNHVENSIQATPMELLVSADNGEQSRKKALDLYVSTLAYMFKGVANYSSSSIKHISVEKSWFGKITKERYSVKWEAISDKSFVVIYNLSLFDITEEMYVADSLNASTGGKNGKEVNPVWIKSLLTPNPKILKENIISAITIATEYLDKYHVAWGFQGKEGLSILDGNYNVIGVEDINDDESFILIQTLMLLLTKGTHMGVFLIDCRGFSDKLLEAFSEMAKLFFGDTYIFMYNVSPSSKVRRSTIELPSFI